MVVVSKTGEVANFTEADQFQWANGKPLSQFECGFFAVAVCRSMAQVGKAPTLSAAQVIADAEQWYAQYDGSDAISNTNGMTTTQLYDLLHQVGLHYQATATDVNVVKRWLATGYPVIIAVTEASVVDLALMTATKNPYPWKAAGTHVIVATGIASDGNLLVRDTANCTDLYNPNSLRPGPRKYDASKLQLVSATVCVPPWMARPASATPPVATPTLAVPPAQTPGTPAQPVTFNADDLKLWNLLQGKLYTDALPRDTGIAQMWLAARRKGLHPGIPMGPEFASVTEANTSFQPFTSALAKWDHGTHTGCFIDDRGATTV